MKYALVAYDCGEKEIIKTKVVEVNDLEQLSQKFQGFVVNNYFSNGQFIALSPDAVQRLSEQLK